MASQKERFVAYYRVSTNRQGVSGLGLEGQQDAVKHYNIVKEFTEIASGRKAKSNPILGEAINYCNNNNCTLLVAKLDRLARNVAFITTLSESGISIKIADMPNAGTLEIGIMATIAQHEAEVISKRIKSALKAKKARGETYKPQKNLNKKARRKGGKLSSKCRRINSLRHTKRAYELVKALKASKTPNKEIVIKLNECGYTTTHGNVYNISRIYNLIKLHERNKSK
jgi:DNA invertase Pin-like site-specific DNA recombinase